MRLRISLGSIGKENLSPATLIGFAHGTIIQAPVNGKYALV